MLTGVEEFLIFGFMPLMIGIFAAPAGRGRARAAPSAARSSSRHPAALPADAVAIVELVEQRRGETVVPVLARETIAWRGAEAQKFAIRFDPSLVRPTAFYALQGAHHRRRGGVVRNALSAAGRAAVRRPADAGADR